MRHARDITQAIRVREGAAVWRRLQDHTIILALDAAVYLRLNETASELWTQVVEGTTRDDMIALLTRQFDTDEQTAARDVDRFISQCRSQGLIDP
jgi:hypothetical protein